MQTKLCFHQVPECSTNDVTMAANPRQDRPEQSVSSKLLKSKQIRQDFQAIKLKQKKWLLHKNINLHYDKFSASLSFLACVLVVVVVVFAFRTSK